MFLLLVKSIASQIVHDNLACVIDYLETQEFTAVGQ